MYGIIGRGLVLPKEQKRVANALVLPLSSMVCGGRRRISRMTFDTP